MKLENIIKELEVIKTIDDDQEGLYHYNKLIETLYGCRRYRGNRKWKIDLKKIK